MFTDMVGYTALGQEDESLSLALANEQRKLIRPILRRHKGREIKTMGDGFLVEFQSALEAVKCAYEIQRSARSYNATVKEKGKLHLRVGVHLGDVVETRGDISGDAVNVASRIDALAEDGGVCITRQVYDQVQNKFDLPLTSLGLKSLKNVGSPLEVYRMEMPWDEQRPSKPPSTSEGDSPTFGPTEEQMKKLSETMDKMKGLGAGIDSKPAAYPSSQESDPLKSLGSRLEQLRALAGSDLVPKEAREEMKSLGDVMKLFKTITGSEFFPKGKTPPEISGLVAKTVSDRGRIAVLPLTSMSPDSKDDYFADGMTEELISTLSRIAGLHVIARTSVARYKATTKPIVEIGKELGVSSILEGSVRKSGNKIRITTQLIDSTSEEHLWAEDYDRDLDDIFTVQSDIAKRIAKALSIIVLQNEDQRLEQKGTKDSEAYSLYLRGRHNYQTRTRDSLKDAIENFDAAIKKDPKFTQAYTGLADAYSVLALLEYVPPKEVFPKAKAAAEKALRLDERLAEAHVSLGIVRFQYEWDWQSAEREFRRALELNPGYAAAHQYYADYLKAMGRFDEALDQMSEAQSLDPLSLAINTGVGHVLYLSRQYDLSIEQYRKTIESDPAFVPARLWFGRPYMQKGLYKEAIEQLREAVKLSNESTVSLAMLGQAYASAGQRPEAQKILDKLIDRSKRQYVPSYWIALVQMSMGAKDMAFMWLERAYKERSSWMVWVNVEPRFDQLRDDDRFKSLTSRMRLTSWTS